MLKKNAVWLITGASRGLGRALAESLLKKGYRVVATGRHASDVQELRNGYGEAALPLELDVTQSASVTEVVRHAIEVFGQIDVLVNNAGYGYLAAIEEGEDSDVRALFETNVLAPVNLVKAVLPGMRERRSGAVVNISSMGGVVTYAGVGYYHMTKFALEGMTGSLAKELAPLGITVTSVEPGAFRTNFRGPGSLKQSSITIADYAETAGKARKGTEEGHGKQQSDPNLAAEAIIRAVEAEKVPVHLALGSDAVTQIRKHLEDTEQELRAWEKTSLGTDIKP